MLAYTYVEQGRFALLEKTRPHVEGPEDVVVRVTLASICTSDLHIKHGSVPRAVPGVTVGHEMVGLVEEVGEKAQKFAPGDRVAVNVETFCGKCFFCRQGYVNNCTDPQGGMGIGLPHRRRPGGICAGALWRPRAEPYSTGGVR